RAQNLLQRLGRRGEARPEVAEPCGQARGERAAAEGPEAAALPAISSAAEAAGAGGAGRDGTLPGCLQLRDAGLDRLLLRSRRRCDPAAHVEGLAAGLELGDDLRDGALLVLGDQHQARGHGGDAVQLLDLLRLRRWVGQLGTRKEEVVDEALAGLAELRQVRDDGTVRGQQVSEPPVAATAAERPAAEAVVRLRRAGDGEIGADPCERVERLLLRVVESVRDRRDSDYERDAEGEPEGREDRPRTASKELVAHVAEEEHPQRTKAPRAKSGLSAG